jgi:transcriptional regulator with XRE-family HTH domain
MSRDPQVLSPFGQQLRHWRRRSGASQLDLALQVGTSPRHVSFIETGRSRPGRNLVLRLAAALDVPIRERNALLTSAGLTPAYPDRELTDQTMRPIKLVLDRVLAGHEPYPAWVVGRNMRFLASNCGAEALFPGMCSLQPHAIVDLWFGPGPFREMVENWPDVVWAGVAALRREATRSSDAQLLNLLQRAEAHARSIPRPDADAIPDLPVICPRLSIHGYTIRTISTVMRFDTAVEVTASELRVELMFPADEESDAYFRRRESLAIGQSAEACSRS